MSFDNASAKVTVTYSSKDLGYVAICSEHGPFKVPEGYDEFRQKAGTFSKNVSAPACPACSNRIAAKQDAASKEVAYHKNRGSAEIPKRFQSSRFTNYDASSDKQKKVLNEVQDYATSFGEAWEAGRCMVWAGPAGTGKTHLAGALLDHIMREGWTGMYASILDASKRIKATYGQGSAETESAAIRRYVTPDLLILDEVGIGYNSDTEKLHMWEIIGSRYNDRKPTILISNLDQKQVQVILGDRIYDRLREGGGTYVAFDWESYRSKAHA